MSFCPRDERTLSASVTYHTPSGLRGPFALAPLLPGVMADLSHSSVFCSTGEGFAGGSGS